MNHNVKHLAVKTSNDYSKFHFLPCNRSIDNKHVQSIIESLLNQGCFRDVIVIKTDMIDGQMKYWIIDGQHLFVALQRLEMPIQFRVQEIKDEIDLVLKMAMINNSSKSWNLIDYVVAFKDYFDDYRMLLKWHNMYDIELSMIAKIADYGITDARISAGKSIKSGQFKITNPEAKEMCDAFNEIFITIGPADRWVKLKFLNVFLRVYGSYDHTETLERLKRNLALIKGMSSDQETMRFISERIFGVKFSN